MGFKVLKSTTIHNKNMRELKMWSYIHEWMIYNKNKT